MGDPESRYQLELVRAPVAKIEGTRAPVLEGIAPRPDVLEMNLRATAHERLHGCIVAGGKFRRMRAQPVEERPIANDGDFPGLGDTAKPVSLGEGSEKFEIVQDSE